MDISLALETLLSAPEGSLESHRSQALSLAETIWRSLRATHPDAATSGVTSSYSSENESVSTEASEPRGASSVSSVDISPSSNDRLRPVRRTPQKDLRPQRLLTTMESRMSDMKKLSEIEAREVVEKVLISFVDEDGRLRDVTRIIGKTNPEDNERLVQCLAQRALALEYTAWESKEHPTKKTRVQELAERLSKANSQRGLIAEYVRQCRRLKSKDDAVRSIRYGIKQLLQEKLLSDKLPEGTECEGIELGIAFAYTDFSPLTFNQQEAFAKLLVSEGSAAHIFNFLSEQSRWIRECQAVYDDYKSGSMALLPSDTRTVYDGSTGRDPTNERSAKRQRQNKDASSISESLRELYPNQSFRPIQKKSRAAYSQLPGYSTVHRLLSPTAEPHRNFFGSAGTPHSQTVTGACTSAFVSANSASSRTSIEHSDLPTEQQVLSFDNSVAAPNEESGAAQHGTEITSQESSAFAQYPNSNRFSEQLDPRFDSLGYYDNTTYPSMPFNNPPLVGFSEWGMVNWDLQGFQDVCFRPVSDSS